MNAINRIAESSNETKFKDRFFPGQGQTRKFDVIITLAAVYNINNAGVRVGDLRKILTNNSGAAVNNIHKCLCYLIDAGLVRRELYGYNFKKPCYEYFLTDAGDAIILLYHKGVNDIKRKLKRGEKIT